LLSKPSSENESFVIFTIPSKLLVNFPKKLFQENNLFKVRYSF